MSPDVVNGPSSNEVLSMSGNLGWRSFIGLCAAATICLSIVFSAAGAYDTDNLDLPHRLLLWLVIIGLVVGQTIVFQILLSQLFDPGPLAQILVGCGTVLATNIVAGLQIHGLKYTRLFPKAPDPIPEFLVFVAPAVMPIAGFIVLASLTVRRITPAARGSRLADSPETSDIAARQDDLATMANWPSTAIMSVRAHDHYLEVRSANGYHFVRGRMKDAALVLDKAAGLQVHRSWWVHRAAIKRIETKGRDKIIILQGGGQVPVARSRIPLLRENGWI